MAKDGEFTDSVFYKGFKLPPFPCLKRNVDERLDEIKRFQVRRGDILLSTFPKSGTHWMFEILNMLIKKNTEYTGMLEGHFLEIVDSMSNLEDIPSPRVLATHLPYGLLPEVHQKHGAKIVHIVRNPKDAHVSFFHHMSANSGNRVTWSAYINNVIRNDGLQLGGWFTYEKGFQNAIKQDNKSHIHIIFYEEILEKPLEELQKLADFLEIEYDLVFLKQVADACSFSNLKKISRTDTKTQAYVGKLLQQIDGMENNHDIFRKGKVGDWKNTFTVAQNDKFNAVFETEMKNSALKNMFYML